MIFDREQARGRLLRRLTDGYPTMPDQLVADLVRLLLETIDEQLDQPVPGPTHPRLELVVDRLSLFTRDTPDGMRVSCDGHALEARPYWRDGR